MCNKCPLLGGESMKYDNSINLKVDDTMFRYIGKVSNEIDCTQSEFVRRCIQLAGPQIQAFPSLIQILPHSVNSAIKQS